MQAAVATTVGTVSPEASAVPQTRGAKSAPATVGRPLRTCCWIRTAGPLAHRHAHPAGWATGRIGAHKGERNHALHQLVDHRAHVARWTKGGIFTAEARSPLRR